MDNNDGAGQAGAAGGNSLGESKHDKRYSFVYQMLTKLFEKAIIRSPYNIKLRIRYIVFLMRNIKS